MKTALSFFIFFMTCWPFVRAAHPQNTIPAFSSAGATAIILSPTSVEMKQIQEFNILELPTLMFKLALDDEKKTDPVRRKSAPFLIMDLAEFNITDLSSQQFAVSTAPDARGIARLKGKTYQAVTESFSIVANNSVQGADRKAFKLRTNLSFNDLPHGGRTDTLRSLVVTVNFN